MLLGNLVELADCGCMGAVAFAGAIIHDVNKVNNGGSLEIGARVGAAGGCGDLAGGKVFFRRE